MKNKVQRALAVMYKETGWLLNYQQLIQNPKYKKDWNTLAENEFGQLAPGAGGHIKGTIKIKFIYKCQVPREWFKDVTYGQFV